MRRNTQRKRKSRRRKERKQARSKVRSGNNNKEKMKKIKIKTKIKKKESEKNEEKGEETDKESEREEEEEERTKTSEDRGAQRRRALGGVKYRRKRLDFPGIIITRSEARPPPVFLPLGGLLVIVFCGHLYLIVFFLCFCSV